MCWFFLSIASPPEIYTYRHTLSLHDALPVSGASWHAKGITNQIVTRRVDSCGDLSGDSMCMPDGGAEVCVEGPETRIIDGVPITEACWAWKRDYMCHAFSSGNDCTALETNASCSFLRTE